ncbi:Arf guanine nucleotide exchange factor sec74 [Schizosaccharomyces pombe]
MDESSRIASSSALHGLDEMVSAHKPSPPLPSRRKGKSALRSALEKKNRKSKSKPKVTITSDTPKVSSQHSPVSSAYTGDSTTDLDSKSGHSSSQKLSNKVSSALKLTIPKRWRSSKSNSSQCSSPFLPTSSSNGHGDDASLNLPDKKSRPSSQSSIFLSNWSTIFSSNASPTDSQLSPTHTSTIAELAASTLSIFPSGSYAGSTFGSPSRSSIDSSTYLPRSKSVNSLSSNFSARTPASNQSSASEDFGAAPNCDHKHNSVTLSDFALPDIDQHDTVETILEKVEFTIPKQFTPAILSQGTSSLLKLCLRKYLSVVNFKCISLDMALRKFLAVYVLPNETQQIDRVLSTFSDQYFHCNPDLYDSSDECYILTFSLMILHTDFFNIHNRQKMTRAEFISNTNLPTILPEILECFYDNITYTPFVHVEHIGCVVTSPSNEKPSLSQRLGDSQFRLTKRNTFATESDHQALQEQLTGFRINLDSILDLKKIDSVRTSIESPTRTADDLYKEFARAPFLQIVSHRSQPQAFSYHFEPSAESESTNPAIINVKVFKLGILIQNEKVRKDRLLSNREVGVILTSSQLMFFKNVYWISGLLDQLEDFKRSHSFSPCYFSPHLTSLSADYIIPLSDLVAYGDGSRIENELYSFSVKQKNQRTHVFSVTNVDELNDWLVKINFVSTFATAGLAPRERLPCVESSDKSIKASVSVLPDIYEDSDAMSKASKETRSEVLECSKVRVYIVQNRIYKLEEALRQGESKMTVQRRNAANILHLEPIQSRTRIRLARCSNTLKKNMLAQMIEIQKFKISIKFLKEDLEMDSHLQDYLRSVFPSSVMGKENASEDTILESNFRNHSNPSVRRSNLRVGKTVESVQNTKLKSVENDSGKAETETVGKNPEVVRKSPAKLPNIANIMTVNGHRYSVVELPDDFLRE